MPTASISNVITGVLKDAKLDTEERIVLAKVFRKAADVLEKVACELAKPQKV